MAQQQDDHLFIRPEDVTRAVETIREGMAHSDLNVRLTATRAMLELGQYELMLRDEGYAAEPAGAAPGATPSAGDFEKNLDNELR